MEWILFVVGIALGTVLGELIINVVKTRRSYKYRWTCTQCPPGNRFTVEASAPDIVERVKSTHTHEV